MLRELRRRHNALGFFFGLGTGTVFTFLPTFAEQLGVRGLGLFYTAYAGAAMLVRLFGGSPHRHPRAAGGDRALDVRAGLDHRDPRRDGRAR